MSPSIVDWHAAPDQNLAGCRGQSVRPDVCRAYPCVVPWQHSFVSKTSMSASQLLARLDQLGAEDWEVVGFAAVDQTVGLNVMTVLLRRWYDSLPAADISEPDWLPDPTGRNVTGARSREAATSFREEGDIFDVGLDFCVSEKVKGTNIVVLAVGIEAGRITRRDVLSSENPYAPNKASIFS